MGHGNSNQVIEARKKLVEAIVAFQEKTGEHAMESADQYKEKGATAAEVSHMIMATGMDWKDFVCTILGIRKKEYYEALRRLRG